MRTLFILPLMILAGCKLNAHESVDPTPIIYLTASAQTTPVPHSGDAADDAAIWIHPTDPSKNLIYATNKLAGLHIYNLAGEEIAHHSADARPDNVDILQNVSLNGELHDLAIAVCRPRVKPAIPGGVKVWRIDRSTGLPADATADDYIPIFNKSSGYGSTVYRSPKSRIPYFFVTSKSGKLEQYEILALPDKTYSAKLVRELNVGSVAEGCVADDEHGHFYVSEETRGIWKFPAEPDDATPGQLIARIGEHGLTPDVEGLTLYKHADGSGYLLASSQGSNNFKIYNRQTHRFVATLAPVRSETIGDVQDTDGIVATSAPCGPDYPQGIFIAQDGQNWGANQNFKIYDWAKLAEKLPKR